jgi:hydroxymethylbilane synthase
MLTQTLRLGTRGSNLALHQAEEVASRLTGTHRNLSVNISVIRTTGDKVLDVALSRIGDKGLFTREIEQALLRGEIDLAVHSLKDLPSELPPGLVLAAVLPRANPADVLLSRSGKHLHELPAGAVIGSSSLRRIAQLKAYRPDLKVVDIRGNVETRIRKMGEQGLDAIVLACAGLSRLGLEAAITQVLPPDIMLPAVGQGAIAVEIRENDNHTRELLQAIKSEETEAEVIAERAFLRELEGGCQVPIACLGRVNGSQLLLQGLVASLDGKQVIRGQKTVGRAGAKIAGIELAAQLKERGAREILENIHLAGEK